MIVPANCNQNACKLLPLFSHPPPATANSVREPKNLFNPERAIRKPKMMFCVWVAILPPLKILGGRTFAMAAQSSSNNILQIESNTLPLIHFPKKVGPNSPLSLEDGLHCSQKDLLQGKGLERCVSSTPVGHAL